MIFILNILWVVFGGFSAALAWMFSSVIMVITIVGIPWARAAFNIGLMSLWPFGSQAVRRETISGADIGTGAFGFIGNIFWFIFAGWWLFLFHCFWAALLCITIIGIPFGVQHWKLAKISLSPIGKSIVWK